MSDTPTPTLSRPATRASAPATTGDTVTVACKMPHGLILRIFDWEDFDEPMRDGTMRTGKRARDTGEHFTLRGTWTASAGQAYMPNNPAIAELLPGGYALTPGVPKDLWEKWYEQNRESAIVRERIVFAHAVHHTVVSEATQMRQVVTGLEPLDRANPAARMPGGVDRRLRIGILDETPR